MSITSKLIMHSSATSRVRGARRLYAALIFALAIALPTALPAPNALAYGGEDRSLRTIRELNPHLAKTNPLDLSIKVWALSRSEYGFFRGTADVFYQWCGEHCRDWLAAARPRILLHGDIHLGNIGTYQSLGRTGEDIRFGVVDLDEVFEGPAQFDLLRGVAALRFLAIDRGLAAKNSDWPAVVDRFCTAYEDALHKRDAASARPEEHAVARSLLAEARSAKCRKYLKKYCDLKARRFLPTRIKKGEVADIMQPVDAAERERVAAAMRHYFESADATAKRALSAGGNCPAMLDAVRWTRLDSSGSQSLRKYLILIETKTPTCDGLLILQLKEEPIPAAARAGLILATPSGDRAAFVARAYGRLLQPAKWLIGHTQIGDTGFLVKTKDPWGEEPSTKMFEGKAGLDAAAGLLGATLGRAHRNAIMSMPDHDVMIQRVAGDVDRAALASRSEAAAAYLMTMYKDLLADDDARRLVKEANDYIDKTRRENKR